MDTATLLWSVVFGSIGLGYCMYGKRQRASVPLICGIGLMVFTWFVPNLWAMLLVGAGLMAIPWLVRL